MKVRVEHLDGPHLSWAVAKARGEDCSVEGAECSLNWSQAGPIIHDMLEDGFILQKADFGLGFKMWRVKGDKLVYGRGASPTLAALRCFVTFTLGDEVDVPASSPETLRDSARAVVDASEGPPADAGAALPASDQHSALHGTRADVLTREALVLIGYLRGGGTERRAKACARVVSCLQELEVLAQRAAAPTDDAESRPNAGVVRLAERIRVNAEGALAQRRDDRHVARSLECIAEDALAIGATGQNEVHDAKA